MNIDYGHATSYSPGLYDEYCQPEPSPALVAPMPQRMMPEMSDQISENLHNMHLGPGSPGMVGAGAFPRLKNPPSNIPPSDEDIEKTLEAARAAVLNSNDPETQLVWAQDALHQIDINIQCRARLQSMQMPATPPSPAEIAIKNDAINIVSFLADQAHPKAEFLKGTWYEFGRFDRPLDKKEAFRCYARSADKQYPRAVYRVGLLYESSNDSVKAVQNYRKGISLGDSACLYRMGMITLRGQYDQPQDFPHGLDLIQRSSLNADENAPQGAYIYGMLFAGDLDQLVLPQGLLWHDERAARVEIEKAAYLKSSKAQLKIGRAYELGELGCDFNPLCSMHYYALASAQGEAAAEMGISKWFLVGAEGYFSKNEELAYAYAKRAALSGLPNGEFAMGYFSELGIHVPRNIDLALEWYHKAAASGNIEAQERIRGISQKQVLNRSDHENIALQRIKTQHGSRRGGRPERFSAQKVPMMASIPQGQLTPGNAGPPPRSSSIPPRASSTAPYPLDDGPPRHGSIAPPYGPNASTQSEFRPSNAPVPGGLPHWSVGSPRIGSEAVSASPRPRIPSGQSPAPPASSHFETPGRPYDRAPSQSPRLGSTGSPAPSRPPKQPEYGAPSRGSNLAPSAPRPPRHGSVAPIPTGSATPKPTTPDLRKTSETPSVRPWDTPSTAGSVSKPAAPANKPSKGPKTFEEMGVPKQKQDSDCTVM